MNIYSMSSVHSINPLMIHNHLNPPLSPNIKVQRPNQLKLRIIINRFQSVPYKLIPTHQLCQQNFYLQQGKIKSNTTPRPRRKRNISATMSSLNLLRIPPIRIKPERIPPGLGIRMDSIQRRDNNAIRRETIPAREHDVSLGGSPWLETGVVEALRLLDELVEVGEAVREIGGPGCLVAFAARADDAVLDELGVEAVLRAYVCDQTVEEPGEERGGGGETGARDDEHVGEDEALREVLAFVVDRVEEVVDDAGGAESGLVHGGVGDAGAGDFVDGFLQQCVDSVLDVAEAGRVAEGEVSVPFSAGSDLLIEREEIGDVRDDRVEGAVD